MKRFFFPLLLSICYLASYSQQTKVLFIGNSYTYVNDLPQLLKNLALSFGDTIYTDQYTPGGYQFNQHAVDATTLSKIASLNWDYVVLQEQSQKPSFPPTQVQSDVYPYATILNNAIKTNSACTETVFYMTWGRKNGDASNCSFYPPLCTYEGMQQRLRESYMEMSATNLATTSPVGVAWKNFRDTYPTVELYSADESHPSLHGSYLAACVFYATLYQKSSIGSSYIPAGISANDALNIQTIATNTVLDSLDLWRINANLPVADFSYAGNETINFTNTSINGVSYSWNFGDGNSSTLENPTNNYTSNGNFTVELITYSTDSCFSDTITKNIDVISAGINDKLNSPYFQIYPNPSTAFITIHTEVNYTSVDIIDVTGKVVKSFSKTMNSINISSLKNGVYFIQVFDNSTRIKTVKWIKQ
jgi:PKD repeat protein